MADPRAAVPLGLVTKWYVRRVAGKRPLLSRRLSLLEGAAADKPTDFASVADLEEGAMVQGFVKNTTSAGCFVQLSEAVVARVQIKMLSATFLKEPAKAFPPGKFIAAARVVSVDAANNRAELSLKALGKEGRSAAAGTEGSLTFDMLKVGDVVRGSVKAVADFGVFVRLAHSSIDGLCHISEAREDEPKLKPAKLRGLFHAGDEVRLAKVTKIDAKKKTVSLTFKASKFSAKDRAAADESDSDSSGSESGDENEEGGILMAVDEESSDMSVYDEDMSGESASESESDAESDSDAQNEPAAGGLAAAWDFGGAAPMADGKDDDGGSSSSDDSDSDAGVLKVSSRKRQTKKRAEAEAAEEKLRAQEADALDPNSAPRSVMDFERSLVGEPFKALLYIEFAAFHLDLAEVGEARAVLERGLGRIPDAREGERADVWIALLNLESQHGTAETLEGVFQRALRRADAATMQYAMLGVHERAGRAEEQAALFRKMLGKPANRRTTRLWLAYAGFQLAQAAGTATADVLRQARKSLSAADYAHLMVKVAIMEYSHEAGVVARGRSLFEAAISEYPKRTDVWSVFIDQEVKADAGAAAVRELFMRFSSLKLNARKMKFVYTKWLEWEGAVGGDVEGVKERARAFVAQHDA